MATYLIDPPRRPRQRPAGPYSATDVRVPLRRHLDRFYPGDRVNIGNAPGQFGSYTGSPILRGLPVGGAGRYCTGGASLDIPSSLPDNTLHLYTWRLVFWPISWTGEFTTLIDTTSRQFSIFVNTSGNISFSGGQGQFVVTALALAAGQRWDLTVVHDDTNTTTYVNGQSRGTAASDAGFSTVTQTIAFGSNPSGGGTNGDYVLESFQFWDRALSPGQVYALYDPQTRWDLYRIPDRRFAFEFEAGGGGISIPVVYHHRQRNF